MTEWDRLGKKLLYPLVSDYIASLDECETLRAGAGENWRFRPVLEESILRWKQADRPDIAWP